MSQRFILGIGSGRCGTLSLAPENGGYKDKRDIQAAAKLKSGFEKLISDIGKMVNRAQGTDLVRAPGGGRGPGQVNRQIYGSSDENPIVGSDGSVHETLPSKSAYEIAEEQFALIQKTIGADGKKLKDGQVYRVLLVGHSWGGDKAIEVANILGTMLACDPDLGPLYEKGEDKIQIHLITLDAIEQGTAKPSSRKIDKGNGVHVASWLNLRQTTDTGFGILIPLNGGSFPGFDDDHTERVDGLLAALKGDAQGDKNGRHALMPGQKDVIGRILGFLRPPEK
ncbi:MAG TPA: hypothetical protein VFI31_00885 [Pirellulales bacterium]|nr:hypothetical protein [Pirellulales bacterium]